MLVILTNSQDATADYLVPILVSRGVSLIRVDTDKVLSDASVSFRPGKPVLRVGAENLNAQQLSNIWYRRPEQLKDQRLNGTAESRFALNEWTEAIEGVFAHVPRERWMNHPSANALASHKLEQLSRAKRIGFKIPDTIVTQVPAEAREFFEQHEQQIIVKPISSGYVERGGHDDSLIYTSRVEEHHLETAHDLRQCPTLFQQLIRKCCDVRITVVDEDIHAIELRASDNDGSQRCDIRRNNMSDVQYNPIELPQSIDQLVRALVKEYELRFAAIDMVVDLDGDWHFLEVNPNGQWAWLDLAAGMTIANSFVKSFSNDRH